MISIESIEICLCEFIEISMMSLIYFLMTRKDEKITRESLAIETTISFLIEEISFYPLDYFYVVEYVPSPTKYGYPAYPYDASYIQRCLTMIRNCDFF
jgi:hypothetical protein